MTDRERKESREQFKAWYLAHKEELDKLPPTEFVGYETLECEATIIFATGN